MRTQMTHAIRMEFVNAIRGRHTSLRILTSGRR